MESLNILVFVIVLAVIVISRLTLKGNINRKIYKYSTKKDYESLFQLLDKFTCKVTYTAFDREFIRLNAYFDMNVYDKIKKQSDFIMDEMRLNDNQKIVFARQTFYYFLRKEKYKECVKVLNFTKTSKTSNDKIHAMEMMYSIEVLKESTYIDDIEKKLNKSEDKENQASLHYLLGLQYAYKQDSENAQKHLSEAKKLTSDFALKDKIDKFKI